MAERSGFFNARLVDGVYDRRYNAEDYRDNLGAIISNGVRRSGDNDLRVSAMGGMQYSVAIGRAWIKGGWYHNDSTYVGTVPTANVTLPRIDRIVLRFNSSNNVRDIHLEYLTGEAASSPVPPELTREGEIYDLCLAEIAVGANAITINQTNITDKRSDATLCGWITTPVGYDDYFVSIDGQMIDHLDLIDEEWQGMKDDWASVTLFKKYEDRIELESTQTVVTVPIVQYNPNTDILDIYVNGIYSVKGVDYTLSGNIVTFTVEKIAGTEISFSVYKSIDGSGDIASLLDIVTQLQNTIGNMANLSEYDYIASGLQDNVKLSEICNAFFDGTDDGKHLKINVYGDFVATAPYSGDGTSVNRYKWLNVSPTGAVSRRITLDFSNCSKIVLPIADGSYNIVFHGKSMTVIGANVEASNIANNTAIEAFGSTNGDIKAIRCRFNFTGYHRTFIGETGTFEQCFAECSVVNGEGYCFYTNAEGLIRIFGGEYRAYTQATSSNAMVVKQSEAGAVVVAYSMNCPTVAKSGYRQTHAINATGGSAVVRDTITQLTVTAGTVSTTISASKPERG